MRAVVALLFALGDAPQPPDDDGVPDLGELPPLPGTGPASTPEDPAPSPPTAPSSEGDEIPDLGELGPLDEPRSTTETEDASSPQRAREPAAPTSAHHPPPVEDLFTGSLRLTGAYLHFDDVPELFPAGDDALLAAVARVITKRDLGRHFGFELNYFLDLSRRPGGGAQAGAFQTAGSAESVYRSRYLSWQFWDDGTVSGVVGADRFVLDAAAGPVRVAVGRFPISMTVTSLFTPNDFIAPFSATAVNRIYKPGADAVRVGVAIGMSSSLEVVGALGNDDDGVPTWGRSAAVGRLSTVRWGFEWAALGGKVAERWIVGGSAQGEAGPVGLRAEGHVGFPDRDGDGRDADDEARPVHVRVAGGPSLDVGWHGLTLAAEYSFVSDGARDPDHYLARALRRFPDDQPILARHYAGATIGMEIVPIVHPGLLVLVNGNDGSGLAGVSLLYNAADEVDILAGVFAPWGKDPIPTGDPALPVMLGSELGTGPVTVYLEARAYF